MKEVENPYRPPASTEMPASKSTGKAKRLWLQMLIGAIPVPLATVFVMVCRDQSFIESLGEGVILTIVVVGSLGLAQTTYQHYSRKLRERKGKEE